MIETIINTAREAGEILKEGFYRPKNINYKSEIDLVTEYDVKIEQFLTEKFRVLFPEYEIIGEESSQEYEIKGKQLIIDPIDGTTNFVHKVPMLGISIGVFEEGKPVAGVVYNPIMDEMYHAVKGEGSYLNGEKIEVSKTDTLTKSLIATGFPYTKVQRGEDFEWVLSCMRNIMPVTRDIRRLGAASIDMCYIARSIFDGYYEVNLKPWDVAAGMIIVTEAGGRYSNKKGEAYTIGKEAIIVSNSHIHDQFVETLEKG